MGESFERIVVAFDEPIDAAENCRGEDVSLVNGPAGARPAARRLLTRSPALSRVRFAPQTRPGDYQLTIGP